MALALSIKQRTDKKRMCCTGQSDKQRKREKRERTERGRERERERKLSVERELVTQTAS